MSFVSKSNQNTIVLLSVLYAAISIAVEGLTFIPAFDTQAEFRLGIFVPGLTATVFGSTLGGLTAGIGNLLIDAYHVFTNKLDLFTPDRLLGALANFIGAYVTGLMSIKSWENVSSVKSYLGKSSTWVKIINNTLAAIIGLGFITGFAIGYGIVWLYLDLGIEVGAAVSYQIFLSNFLVLVIFMPLSIFIFDMVKISNYNRLMALDKANQELNVTIEDNGVQINRVWLPHHSLYRGQFTQINIEHTNNTKDSHFYEIEAISDAKIYPHFNQSKTFVPSGKSREEEFYVFPHPGQSEVNIRFLVSTVDKPGFKKAPEIKSQAEVRAKAIDKSGNSLLEFSGANIIVLLFSVLWSNISDIFQDELVYASENLTLLGIVFAIELFLFVPLLYFQHRRFKAIFSEEQTHQLSFAHDITSHGYAKVQEESQKSKIDLSENIIARSIAFVVLISATAALAYDFYSQVFLGSESEVTSYRDYLVIALLGLVLINILLFRERKGKRASFDMGESQFITTFRPLQPFKINHTSQIMVDVNNTFGKKGLLLLFETLDDLSIPSIELHIDKNETAQFLLSITPLNTGNREILIVAYPLFDNKGEPVDTNLTEPLAYQKVNFSAQHETTLGITTKQSKMLKKIASYGSVAAAGLVSISSIIGIDDVILKLRDILPLLGIMQLPFIYGYFYISNRMKRSLRL